MVILMFDATSLDDFSQVTSLKRVGGWLHLWANNGPFEELQAIADGLESAEAIYLCAPDNCDGLSRLMPSLSVESRGLVRARTPH